MLGVSVFPGASRARMCRDLSDRPGEGEAGRDDHRSRAAVCGCAEGALTSTAGVAGIPPAATRRLLDRGWVSCPHLHDAHRAPAPHRLLGHESMSHNEPGRLPEETAWSPMSALSLGGVQDQLWLGWLACGHWSMAAPSAWDPPATVTSMPVPMFFRMKLPTALLPSARHPWLGVPRHE